MNIYRVAGGITFLLIGLAAFGIHLPGIIRGVAALVAGVALLAGA